MLQSSEFPPDIDRTSGPTPTPPRLVERHYLSLSDPTQFRPGTNGKGAAVGGSTGVGSTGATSEVSTKATLRTLPHTAIAEWRALYERVGAQWSWHDRNAWSDERLANYLALPDVTAYAVYAPPVTDGGMLELCTHTDGSVEIVYLGLIPELFGRGLGAWLLGEAVRLAWERGAHRIWLHTCTLDGPNALPNYLARGFTIDRTETYSIDAAG